MTKYHLIGIGGIGMSALARILLQRGEKVSGSDLAASPITQQLQAEGAEIFIGHTADNIRDQTVIVYSSAVPQNNPEWEAMHSQGKKVMHRSELLLQLMAGYRPLLVAGTHGKTTTSSLLAHLLVAAEFHPAYAIGGTVRSLGSNGAHGTGPYFVAEADESDGSFLKYHPFGAILTNSDNDHLDYWKTEEALLAGYQTFADQVASPHHFLFCGDDAQLSSLRLKGISYGFEEKNALCVMNYQQVGWKNVFDLTYEGTTYSGIEIPLIGGHNVLNAAAVWGMGLCLNIPEEALRSAFQSFQGVNRRVEKKGAVQAIAIYDDYAHHPAEIFATLHAVKRALNGHRLVVAFQPHRYTRTRDCMAEFGPCFENADVLLITDIYAAGEMPIRGVTTEALVDKIRDSSSIDLHYVPRPQLTDFIVHFLQPQDVLLTLGAGDITKVGPEVLTQMPV